MREALELKSKSGVHRLISALEERGFIRRLANRASALEVVKITETRPSASVTSSSMLRATGRTRKAVTRTGRPSSAIGLPSADVTSATPRPWARSQ